MKTLEKLGAVTLMLCTCPQYTLAEVTNILEFQLSYSYIVAGQTPSFIVYEPATNTFLSTTRSDESQLGILSHGGQPLLANDIVGVSTINAVINNSGELVEGRFTVSGGSETLGIVNGSTLLSATLTAVNYNPSVSDSIRMRARVDSINPAFKEVVGTIQSLFLEELFVPSGPFVDNPWNVLFVGNSPISSPNIFLSHAVLPVTIEESLSEHVAGGSAVPPNTSYNHLNNAYSMFAPFGEAGEPGRITNLDNSTTVLNDLVSSLTLLASIDEEGIVLDGNFDWIGGSAILGIAEGSSLISGVVMETYFGAFAGAPKIQFLIDVQSIHPQLENAIGPVRTIVLNDFQSPPPLFTQDPWNSSFNNSSYAFGPQVLLSTESLMSADSDADGIANSFDNCIEVQNGNQRDTDGDGIGSACDADLNNDCVVNFADVAQFSQVFLSSNADADFNGDGVVNFSDYLTLTSRFLENYSQFSPSGPPNICSSN